MANILKAYFPIHERKEKYIHRMKQLSDTGVEVELLQEYIFVTLDNLKRYYIIKVEV